MNARTAKLISAAAQMEDPRGPKAIDRLKTLWLATPRPQRHFWRRRLKRIVGGTR